jgi:Xaa-Pro aminopeptidase
VDHEARRRRLIERIAALEVEAFLVTRLPNVRYLTGFTGSNGQLVVTATDAAFLTDGRYVVQSRREVPDLRRGIYTSGSMSQAVARACRDLGARRVAFEAAGVTYQDFAALTKHGDGLELVPTVDEVERLRWPKDPDERECLQDAQRMADDAFEAVLGRLSEGVAEREIALELDAAIRRAGAEGAAFDTIVAFGDNAAEPHHRPTDRRVARGEVVLVDFGATVEGYRSDMTRTVAFGEPDGRLRDVYELVRRAHQVGVGAVRSGATGGEVDEATRTVIEEAGQGESFTHPLGHGVGLEVHEGPGLRPGGKDVLPAAAVVTVEPGVYLPGVGGVRIEDMVEVTADGGRVIPRTTKELVVL